MPEVEFPSRFMMPATKANSEIQRSESQTRIPQGCKPPAASCAPLLGVSLFVTVWLLVVPVAAAYGQIPQVVQLPSISTFSYSGVVSVPDGGTTSLGGIRRSGSFSSSSGFGPFRSRSRGGFASASGLSVSAQIIDLDEMDRQILSSQRHGVARGLGGGIGDSIRDREIALARLEDQRRNANLARLSNRPTSAMVDRSGNRNRSQSANPAAMAIADAPTIDPNLGRATALVRYAREQKRSGDPGLARIAYHMAIEKLGEHPRHAARAKQELAAIEVGQTQH